MALAAGDRIGPYSITSLVGQGGMGEVYRAQDSKLERDVAIKVLPGQLTTDAERVARFEREARTLAALNHSHIAQVYGLEHTGDRLALVMEFVDGEDLAQRLTRGALPLDEALPIAKQIAEGLAYAHEHGIVHRDLKPANVKVTPDGVVKILDFGLAKAFDPAAESGASDSIALSPTITSPAMTQRGVILGTAAYMSPEQARGRPVDRRTDVWAFGCVLFELLSGARLFEGEDVTETIVSVMTREPKWDALPATTPAPVRKLLRRCLQRDRARRLSDMHVAQLDLEDVMSGASDGEAAPHTTTRTVAPSPWQPSWWAVPGLVLGAAGVWALQTTGVMPGATAPTSAPALRVSLVHTEGSEVGAPAISPDASSVAYRARNADGVPLLWVRDLASGDSRPLAGTVDAQFPFWSPDSREIGFSADGALKRVPAQGGPIQILATTGFTSFGASWSREGAVLFNRSDLDPIFKTTLAGAIEPVTKGAPDTTHVWPSWLPDGRRFLFTVKSYTDSLEGGTQGIYLGSLDSDGVTRLLPDGSSAVYSGTGHLVFSRGGALTAAPFDATSGRVTGEPFGLGVEVAADPYSLLAGLSAASDGTLAVRPAPGILGTNSYGQRALSLLDRSGRTLNTVVTALPTAGGRLSFHRDGVNVAISSQEVATGSEDLHLVNLQSGKQEPLVVSRNWVGVPVWSPDGARLAFADQPAGAADDVLVMDRATGKVTTIVQSTNDLEQPMAWSRDGRFLLVRRRVSVKLSIDVWSFDDRKLRPFVQDSGRTTQIAAFSPDDRFVAYSTASQSGRFEAVVTTFPDNRQQWTLTTQGGYVISWSQDGREILVATMAGHIESYPVELGGVSFRVGSPTLLLKHLGQAAQLAAATADHTRFVVRTLPDIERDKGEIRLLFGWNGRIPR